MKVLIPGRNQVGWAKEFTCTGHGNGGGGCGATLLVEQGDLFKTQSCSMGETDTFITFECGECQVWTDITNVPSQITQTLHVRVPRPLRPRNSNDGWP